MVGQSQNRGRMEIVQILHDTEYLADYGINKYDVYVQKNEADVVMAWKSFMNGQITVEYDIDAGDELI